MKDPSIWDPYKLRRTYHGPIAIVTAMKDWQATYKDSMYLGRSLFKDTMTAVWEQQLRSAEKGRFSGELQCRISYMYHYY